MQDQDISGIIIQVVVIGLALALLVVFALDDRKSRRERAEEDRIKAEGQAPSDEASTEKTP